MHVADLDGDGDHDLAVANVLSADVSILLNVGDGTFAAVGPVGFGGFADRVEALERAREIVAFRSEQTAEADDTAGTWTWDGRDDSGALVSSGVYFCEMAANSERVRGGMVLLK